MSKSRSRMDQKSRKRYQYLVHKCKYCRHRFLGINGGNRFLSHLRHHELTIKTYWYRNSTVKSSITAKRGKGGILRNRQEVLREPVVVLTRLKDTTSAVRLYLAMQNESTETACKVTLASASHSKTVHGKASDDFVNATPTEISRVQMDKIQENVNSPRSSKTDEKMVQDGDVAKDRPNHVSKHRISPNAHRYCNDKCQQSASKGMTTIDGKSAQKRYHCQFCPRCFTQKGGLVIHERVHLGEKPFGCDVCGKSFHDKSNLTKHKRIHSGDKIYKCKHCGKSFSDPSGFKQHENMHTLKPTFKCTYCDRLFTRKPSKVQHERTHTGLKPFSCSVCGRKFSLLGDLNKHEMLHTGERPHKCHFENCDAAFTRAYTLTCHIRTHNGVKPYKCGRCERRFTTGVARSKHELSHYAKFKCDYCPREFGSPSGKKFHEQTYHIQNGEPVHPCRVCGKLYTCPYGRNKHEKRAHLYSHSSYMCPREGCTETFRNTYSIATHLITAHAQIDNPRWCENCEKSFPTEYIKVAHQQRCMALP